MQKKNHQPEEETLVDEVLKEEEATKLAPEENPETDWQAKSEEYLNDLKRLQADFENYKRRQTEAQKELGGYLIEKLVLDIVPVLDNFRAATMHVPADQKESPWVVGIQYIEKQLETVLTENGLTLVESAIGETFDPAKHEAIETAEGEDEASNTITKIHQKGYQLGTRVIRPAKVAVK